MSKKLEPDVQFVDRLEWQLATEYRRLNRLKPAPGKVAIPRRIVAIALLAGVLTTGVTVIKAAEYIKDSWRKKIEVARAETEVMLKQAHLRSAQEQAARMRSLVATGQAGEEDIRWIEIGVEKAALDLKRSELNLEEARASGVAPRNELYAPVVAGRDFVGERLEIEIAGLGAELGWRQKHLKLIQSRIELGLVNSDEEDPIKMGIADQEAMLDGARKRLALRRRFVAGEIKADEVEVQSLMSTAEANVNRIQSTVDALKKRLERFRSLEAAGMISNTEVRQLQFALDSAQAELSLAVLEVDVLRKVK